MKSFLILLVSINAFAELINVPATPPSPSVAQVQKQVKEQLKQQITRFYKINADQFKMLFDEVWNNDVLTPQQVFDSMGKDSVQLLSALSAIQTSINSMVAGTLPQVPPVKYTVNKDGTVAVLKVVAPAK